MKKLKLNLEDLRVESFETSETKSNIGTVVGQATGDLCTEVHCVTETSSCQGSCVQSCVEISFCPECPPTQHHTCLPFVYTCGGQATCP